MPLSTHPCLRRDSTLVRLSRLFCTTKQRDAEGDALRDKETRRLLERGIQQYSAKDASLDEGDQTWERALNIYQMVQDLKGEARLLLVMGDACGTLRKCRKTVYYYEKAIPIFQQLNDQGGEAKALSSLASTYLPKDSANVDRQEVEEAIALDQKALAIYQQLNDQKSKAQALLNLGLAHAALSNYEQAISYYNQALPIVQALKDPKIEGELLFRLGLAYDLQSKYPEAIRYYQQAIPVFSQIPPSLNNGDIEGETMKNLGIIYDSLSKNEESIEYYKKALSIYQKHKNRPGQVIVLDYLAKVYSRTRQHKEAADCYELALSIYRQDNTDQEYNTEIEKILFSLGNSYMAMSQHQKAIRYYEELRAIYESNPNPMRVEVYAGLMTQLNNARRALSQPEKDFFGMPTTSLYSSMGRSTDTEAYYELAVFYQQNNQPELAIVLYKKVVNIHETFRQELSMAGRANNPFGLDNQQASAVQNSYKENVAGTYRALADLLLQQNRIVEALQVLDLLKVEDLQDFFSVSRSDDRFNESIELLPEEKRISQSFLGLVTHNILSELLWKDFTTNANGDVLTARGIPVSRQNLADAKSSQASQRQLIRAFSEDSKIKPDIQKLRQTAPDQNLKLKAYQDLQTRVQKLGKNIALFYPLILDDRLELVVFLPDRPPIRRTVAVSRKQLEATIQTFSKTIKDSYTWDVKQPAQQLYTWLIQPFAADLQQANVQTIVYAPDGQMRYVPLAALYDGQQWLTQRFQINYLTALALTPLEPRSTAAPRILAGAYAQGRYTFQVAGQTYEFDGLPFARTEVERLAAQFPNTTSLFDKAFDRSTILAQKERYNILHFATHAAFVPGRPEDSFIVLGDGSQINLREIGKWKLPNTQLVVLSACQTAIGEKLGNGLEVLGFGYQLQRTGVRASIASLWSVNDAGTQTLMNNFYAILKASNLTETEALQKAQIALMNNQTTLNLPDKRGVVQPLTLNQPTRPDLKSIGYSHPYYWAPFILIGNGL